MMTESRLLLFGFGYTAERLCLRAQSKGWHVRAVVRSEQTRQQAQGLGADAISVNDIDQVDAAASEANAILIVAPPTEGYCPGLKALTPALARRDRSELRWIGYVSSTAVYGDQQGAWTDESSALNTTSPTGQRRLDAERAWSALCQQLDLPLVIFRLAGIYGPGRSAFDRIREGRARRIEKSNHVLSRIHVDDIVGLLEASMLNAPLSTDASSEAALPISPVREPPMQHDDSSRIYNVCDDEPASTADVVTYAARLLGVEPPVAEPFESAVMSSAAERYFLESRRISNGRAKSELGWRPRYPSYREGLAALLEDETARKGLR